MGHIKYLYWAGTSETWLSNDIDITAQVSEDGYYSFKDLNGTHINYLKKQGFPYVDIISSMCICVYYLEGQKDDAINKLKDAINDRIIVLQNKILTYRAILTTLLV